MAPIDWRRLAITWRREVQKLTEEQVALAKQDEWLTDYLGECIEEAWNERGEIDLRDDQPLNGITNLISFLDQIGYERLAQRVAVMLQSYEYNWDDSDQWRVYMERYNVVTAMPEERELNNWENFTDEELIATINYTGPMPITREELELTCDESGWTPVIMAERILGGE